jgi:hypothetical protein
MNIPARLPELALSHSQLRHCMVQGWYQGPQLDCMGCSCWLCERQRRFIPGCC